MTRTCRGCREYPNCRREIPYPGQNYCPDCLRVVNRISREPAWRTWTREHQNAKAIA